MAFKVLAGILLFSLAITVIGLLSPLLIGVAITILVLARRRPSIVTRMAQHRWSRRVPEPLRTTPMRFAVALAVVVIPVSLALGIVAYSSLVSSWSDSGSDGDDGASTSRAATTATESQAASTVEPTSMPSPTTLPSPTATAQEAMPTNEPTSVVASTDAPAPTVMPTLEPTETETAPPASAPEASIQGLAAVDVTGNLEDRGFTCNGPTLGQSLAIWTCEFADPGGIYEVSVEIYGDGPTRIVLVDTTVLNFGSAPTGEVAAPILMFLATLPYEGNDPERARVWVAEQIDAGGELIIGSANFILTVGDRARFLEISAVDVSP